LHPLRGIVRGDDKWIDAPRPERYDLAADPHETDNRYTPADALSGELRAATSQLLESAALAAARYGDAALEPDADTTARLRALGYRSARIASDDFMRGPDPKDKVADLREVLTAESLIGAGRPERAAARLAALLRDADYVNPRALTRLAELAPAEPARALAIETLLPYLERDLNRELRFVVAAKLGVALGRSGRYTEALRAYEIAAQLEPDNPEVQRGLENARRLHAEAR
jgi:tetratricopeptide (TPR) repeat protein